MSVSINMMKNFLRIENKLVKVTHFSSPNANSLANHSRHVKICNSIPIIMETRNKKRLPWQNKGKSINSKLK